MTVNNKVKEVLQEFNISLEDGISYLIILYYGLNPSYIPPILIKKINMTKIYEEDNGTIKWNVPLFEEQITGFEWVKEWMEGFESRNTNRKGNLKLCIARMKKFFVENPDVRKDDVMYATQMYFDNTNNYEYLTTSHYFISKGKGLEKISMLKDWVDKYRIATNQQGRNSSSNTMK